MSDWDVKNVILVLALTKNAGSCSLMLCSHLWLWQASNRE